MSQQVKESKQQYYLKINNFCLCRLVLLSVYVQSEYVSTVRTFKQRYYRNINNLRLHRPVLLSGNVKCEHVATVEMFQTTILSEP